MQLEGPSLESLTHRLTETPEDFLAEPRIGMAGSVHVVAVVNDLLRLDGDADRFDFTTFRSTEVRRDRNRLAVVLLLCSLLADEWFRGRAKAPAVFHLLTEGATLLATNTSARKFREDAERREEMSRFALAQLGLRPAGESVAQAQDRLTSISSAERTRVIAASQAAEMRARQIREALVKKAAEESADKWTRE